MALSGNFSNYPVTKFGLYVDWSVVQSIAGNYSDITLDIYLQYYTISVVSKSCTCTVDGYDIPFTSPAKTDYKEEGWKRFLLSSISTRVNHDSQGKCEDLALSVSYPFNGTYSQTYVGTITASTTVDLNVIPRATQPTVSPSSADIGTAVTISMPRAVASYTHTLTYTLGAASGTIGTALGTSKTWTVPTNLGSYISGSSAACTITCTTYSGNALIGTKTTSLTVKIPQGETEKPVVVCSLSPSGSPSGFSGLYIEGKTGVAYNFAGSYAKNGATITSYSLEADAKTYSGVSGTTDPIVRYLNRNISCTVTDSRGLSKTEYKIITVIPYSKPRVRPKTGYDDVTCERCDSSGVPTSSGTYLLIRAKREYSTVTSNNVQNNFCELRYRYKYAEGQWYSWHTLIARDSLSSNEIETVLSLGLITTEEYTVEIGVVDDIGETSSIIFNIPTDSVTLHLPIGGNGLGVGQYCTIAGAFQCAYDPYFKGSPMQAFISSIDTYYPYEAVRDSSDVVRRWSGEWLIIKLTNGLTALLTEAWYSNLNFTDWYQHSEIDAKVCDLELSEATCIPYGMTFEEIPHVFATIGEAYDVQGSTKVRGLSGIYLTNKYSPTTTKAPGFMACRPMTGTLEHLKVNILVVGREAEE